MENIPAMPQPPADYGYAFSLSSWIIVVLLAGIIAVLVAYRYDRNKQDEKRESQLDRIGNERKSEREAADKKFSESLAGMEASVLGEVRRLEAELRAVKDANASLKADVDALRVHIDYLKK